MDLGDILNRRSDLSTFLVHLTRETDGALASENLRSIILERKIRARSVFGHLRTHLQEKNHNLDSQKCVCFTETPLEYTHLLVAEIANRDFTFSKYGLALTKKVARLRGVNPVWYVDITQPPVGYRDWLATPLDRSE